MSLASTLVILSLAASLALLAVVLVVVGRRLQAEARRERRLDEAPPSVETDESRSQEWTGRNRRPSRFGGLPGFGGPTPVEGPPPRGPNDRRADGADQPTPIDQGKPSSRLVEPNLDQARRAGPPPEA